MRLVINGVDFDTLLEQAAQRVYSNILRRLAIAKASGRPKPGLSAGQFWRQDKLRAGIPVPPRRRRTP
jgi:hypothetical protein